MVQTSHFFINFMKLMIEHDLFKSCPVGKAKGLCYDKPLEIGANRSRVGLICSHGDYNCSYSKSLKYATEYIYW